MTVYHDHVILSVYQTDGMMVAHALDAFSTHLIADCKIAGLLRSMSAPSGCWFPYSPSSKSITIRGIPYMNVCMQLQRALKTTCITLISVQVISTVATSQTLKQADVVDGGVAFLGGSGGRMFEECIIIVHPLI